MDVAVVLFGVVAAFAVLVALFGKKGGVYLGGRWFSSLAPRSAA